MDNLRKPENRFVESIVESMNKDHHFPPAAFRRAGDLGCELILINVFCCRRNKFASGIARHRSRPLHVPNRPYVIRRNGNRNGRIGDGGCALATEHLPRIFQRRLPRCRNKDRDPCRSRRNSIDRNHCLVRHAGARSTYKTCSCYDQNTQHKLAPIWQTLSASTHRAAPVTWTGIASGKRQPSIDAPKASS